MKLTEKVISALVCDKGRKDRLVFDDQVRGLGVRISASGNKNFIVQFNTVTGEKRRLPIGAWGAVTLEQARSTAKASIGLAAAGRDPFAERKASKEAALKTNANRLTLQALLKYWAEIGLADRREGYRWESVRAISVAFAHFLTRPAGDLTRLDAIVVFDELVRAGKPSMASRTLAYARACFSWALKHGHLETNPFAGLPMTSTTTTRERVLSDAEIGAIFNSCEALGYPFGPLFQILLLTAQRRDEGAGMRYSELSKDGATWTIPADRSKNRKTHEVHLAAPVRSIIAALPHHPNSDLVFSTNGVTPVSGFSRARARLDASVDMSNDWRLHDFRRTCVTWLAGAGFNTAVADKILNHTTLAGLTTVGRTYQRAEFLPERRQALEAWAEHVIRLSMRCAAHQVNLSAIQEGEQIEPQTSPRRIA
jgi:integrase